LKIAGSGKKGMTGRAAVFPAAREPVSPPPDFPEKTAKNDDLLSFCVPIPAVASFMKLYHGRY